MLNVTGLARRCGLSRTTILYYESVGLLKATSRSPGGNYRQYGEKDVERLRQICAYRHMGLRLADIRSIMGRPSGDAASVLNRRLLELDREIESLRGHQRDILRLLGSTRLGSTDMMTKDKWVAIMKGCGFTEEQMNAWHVEFERAAPDDHQQFLEYLQIPAADVARIREWAKKGKKG